MIFYKWRRMVNPPKKMAWGKEKEKFLMEVIQEYDVNWNRIPIEVDDFSATKKQIQEKWVYFIWIISIAFYIIFYSADSRNRWTQSCDLESLREWKTVWCFWRLRNWRVILRGRSILESWLPICLGDTNLPGETGLRTCLPIISSLGRCKLRPQFY